MMSSKAYNIASCLATGAFSLHDLLATMLHVDQIAKEVVDKYLYDGLREMVERGWIQWAYEPDYGNAPSQNPEIYDIDHFDYDWRRCTARGPLREGVPDATNPTMLFEATDTLDMELDKPEYQTRQ